MLIDGLFALYVRGPSHPMKVRVVRWMGRTMLPELGVVADVGEGLRLRLHPRDWIEYLLLQGLPYEPLTLEFIASNIVAGDGVVLAGTNFGLHSAVAARAVGTSGLAIGVEPQPAAVLKTWMNLELNGLAPSARLVHAALGDREALVPMAWSDPDNAGTASLTAAGAGFVVPMLRLDSITPLLGSRRFRLLLLDVEGYETKALAGLNPSAAPEIAVVEVEPTLLARAGACATDVVASLTRAGYSLFDLRGRPDPDLADLPEHNLVATRTATGVRWATGVRASVG